MDFVQRGIPPQFLAIAERMGLPTSKEGMVDLMKGKVLDFINEMDTSVLEERSPGLLSIWRKQHQHLLQTILREVEETADLPHKEEILETLTITKEMYEEEGEGVKIADELVFVVSRLTSEAWKYVLGQETPFRDASTCSSLSNEYLGDQLCLHQWWDKITPETRSYLPRLWARLLALAIIPLTPWRSLLDSLESFVQDKSEKCVNVVNFFLETSVDLAHPNQLSTLDQMGALFHRAADVAEPFHSEIASRIRQVDTTDFSTVKSSLLNMFSEMKTAVGEHAEPGEATLISSLLSSFGQGSEEEEGVPHGLMGIQQNIASVVNAVFNGEAAPEAAGELHQTVQHLGSYLRDALSPSEGSSSGEGSSSAHGPGHGPGHGQLPEQLRERLQQLSMDPEQLEELRAMLESSGVFPPH